MVREMPVDFALLVPPGAESVNNRSGTPEIFAVNAIEPWARADIGRPDGAKMTANVSIIST